MKINVQEIYEHIKKGPTKYNEEFHCKMLIEIMTDKHRGTLAHFCTEAMISETTFGNWLKQNDTFEDLYSLCKMFARRAWEDEGRELRDMVLPMGTMSNAFEYWRLVGWSRFGISKNARIKLDLNPDANPNEHYAQLLKQASKGDFTAGEIKQLMEAVNVGLNTHQAFALQKEIDQLKSDLAIMAANSNVQNTLTNKGIA